MAHILHVIPRLTGGGAERQLALLANLQTVRGHEVHIAVLHPEVPPQLQNTAVRVHVLKASSNHDPMLVWRLCSLIRATRADIVQTWLTLPDVLGGMAALITRRPWILSERSAAEAYPPSWKHSARARLAKYCSAIIPNSNGGVRYWLSRGISAGRITEIPNAVDLRAVQSAPLAPLPASCENRPMVLFVGRFSEEKNPLVLIDALVVALADSNAVALMCGFGPMELDIRNRIAMHNAEDKIVLAGHRSDVVGLMKQARLCVAISRFEGSPNVVLEAMAAECPLVVSDIPSYRERLDEECALFVPVRDVDATAQAIKTVLSDPAAAATRAARARTRIEPFTPEAVESALDAVYNRVVYARQ